MLRQATLLGTIFLGIAGCGVRGNPIPDAGSGDAGSGGSCSPGGPAFICEGNDAIACNPDGTEGSRESCSPLICVRGEGCVFCDPNSFQCNGNTVERCAADGSAWIPGETCDPSTGRMCNANVGACTSPCDDAAASESYIGCEYYPVTTLNSQVANEFLPAVVVANPQPSAVTVTVTGPSGFSMNTSVAAGATQTITLPWVPALKGMFSMEQSTLVSGGAYRLVSSLPVTVYQFNALEYRIDQDCIDPETGDCDASTVDPFFGFPECDNVCFSHTNDASLLLPAHVMTGNYVVMSRPTMLTQIDQGLGPQGIPSPGFFAVVGVSETPVTVDIRFTANTVAGSGVAAQSPGSNGTFTLNRGDVLQIVSAVPGSCTPGATDNVNGVTITYCNTGPTYDLTGTVIRASGPVQVIGGHNCDFVPYNRWACDHLEEALFPQEAWDEEAIVSASQPLEGEPNIVRILSGSDGNAITFDPVPSGAPGTMTLNEGQYFEFETRESFRVRGTAAILVSQFLVGQDYAGINPDAPPGREGDPSFSLAIPSEQYRTEYTFLAPSTYPTNFVNVTAPTGASITLDGTAVTGFQPVGATGFSVARVPIPSGQHTITGSAGFGIVVYGFGSYTSYMYPGGLDLEIINPLI